jgi:glycosyltransferase involved in cell wall biosynthesis
MRILIIGGISRSLINFRGPLIRAMLAAGHKVTACAGTPEAEVATILEKWGVRFIPVPLARAGMNPLGDLQTFLAIRRIMRQERPDTVLAYTIKPVIWGGLAAHSAGIHNMYSLITGLGYAFMEEQTTDSRLKTADLLENNKPATKNEERRTKNQVLKQRLAGWVAKRLYKASLKHSQKVFFQNPDDRDAFVQLKLVDRAKTVVVSGSGIDLDHFGQTADLPLAPSQELKTKYQEPRTSFLLIARLLRDKGICEYAEAAAVIKRDYPETEFHLLGDYDPNPSGLKPTEIKEWVKAGTIIYHGQQPDVRPFLRACDVYVLPSYYREGTPRTVLEAMAMGRPIITTDTPGCRETVQGKDEGGNLRPESVGYQLPTTVYNKARRVYEVRGKLRIGANGILIPPRDADALADAMRFFIENPEQISVMGKESRRYAEERYDVHKVNAVIMREMGLIQRAAGS